MSPRSRGARRFTRRRLIALGAGLVGAALITGCDDEDEANGGGTSTPTPTPAFTDGRAMTLRRRPALPPQAAGSLRLGVMPPDDEESLAPLERQLVYSRLVGLDPRQPVIYADLADEIEFVDHLTLRMTLRPDVTFHADATDARHPLDAEAVVRDFERRADEGVYLFSEVIDRLEAPESDILVMRLRAPFALLFELLAAPDASIRGDTRYESVDAHVGSGPFLPVGRHAWGRALRASTEWYGGIPGVAEIEAVYAGEEEDLDEAFLAGDLDVRIHPGPDSRQEAAAREDAVALSRPSRGMRGLGLSMLGQKGNRSVRYVPEFEDDRVRRAVSMALDRDGLNDLDGAKLAGPVGPSHGGDAVPSVELRAHPLFEHDPGEARRLLAAAGAEGLEFGIQHQDTEGNLIMGRLIRDQLTEAGFEPHLEAVSLEEWETVFVQGDFEAAIFELSALETPDLGLRLHASGGLTGRYSLWGYSNPVYDAAVREALSEIDPAGRARRSREAQRLLLEQVPGMFPISAPLDHASVAAAVQGFEFDAYGFNTGYLSGGWTLDDGTGAPPPGNDDGDDEGADDDDDASDEGDDG